MNAESPSLPAPDGPQLTPRQRYSAAYVSAGENPISANIRHALSALRRHFWMALAIVGAAVAIALVSTMLDTPRYTATTSVQINDQSDEVLGKDFEGSIAPPSDWDVDRFLNTQLDILRSRGLAERVADALDLANNERFFASMEIPPGAVTGDARQKRDTAIALLRGNMQIDLPRSTRIAAIGFTSTDPGMSASVADAFAAEFIQANLQRRFDSTSYARNFVAEQLEEARGSLEQSERELNDYAKSVGLIRTRDTFAPSSRDVAAGTMTSSSLLQLNDAAIAARADRIAAQSRWEAVRGAPLMSSRVVIENPTVQSLMTRKAELESQLQSARERYLPGHPAVARLESDVSTTTAQLNRTAAQVRDSIRAEYTAAQASEARLDTQVRQARGDTLAEQDQSVRYNVLAREADTARSIYDGLLQRYRELNASAGIASSNISIIDKAETPTSPSSPNLPRNLALGLLIGLAAAAIAVFLRDQLDDVIHTPEDVEDKLGLSLLGVVPRSEDGDPLEAMASPKTPIAEAYNSLRGALLYSTPRGLPRIMVVTSAQAHEGKSTTSYALAEGFARIGMKPLLIDADLRRPALHKFADHRPERGLTDLLISQDDPAGVIVPLSEGGVDLLASGPLPPSPSELLSSPRMAQLLEQLSETYDVIVVDSPPVLGLADAPMLAAIADGTVFVVEAERGRSGALKAALRRLRTMEPVILGAVLTKFDPTRSGNRYSAYYGYDYYQYAGGEQGASA
ncbi:GumC family protein [Qipengyuania marisflavi]|uniref:non-specific protein-tyrosine kinase n=1 Tax=Qipengyuania marisflavi TaxID=2486356 RepID=A0A5S3PAE0_9SPHN|nr:polysaccharide biosynthesis tyrosine autokinase [Qipengyuania marisflavi]TMM50428.1 polysaccharide biosynthesis tyrosine autokinase [Qipengyuania marisflavi]